jgi:hypothetical protein
MVGAISFQVAKSPDEEKGDEVLTKRIPMSEQLFPETTAMRLLLV